MRTVMIVHKVHHYPTNMLTDQLTSGNMHLPSHDSECLSWSPKEPMSFTDMKRTANLLKYCGKVANSESTRRNTPPKAYAALAGSRSPRQSIKWVRKDLKMQDRSVTSVLAHYAGLNYDLVFQAKKKTNK